MPEQQTRNKQPTSMRLSPEALRLARALAAQLGISQAAVLEIALREKAERMGMVVAPTPQVSRALPPRAPLPASEEESR